MKKSNILAGMQAHWYQPRECYRVWIPARLSENGKRWRRFFATKTEAEKFIFQTLKPLAGVGPVVPIPSKAFYSMRRELCKEMRVRWPENCLRNSYATYAQTFRSSGDVARAMGDAESTVKRFYVRTLEPGVGKKRGYGCFSVSRSNVSKARSYIAEQPQHHQVRSFQDELRLLLSRHGVDYDERYLRD